MRDLPRLRLLKLIGQAGRTHHTRLLGGESDSLWLLEGGGIHLTRGDPHEVPLHLLCLPVVYIDWRHESRRSNRGMGHGHCVMLHGWYGILDGI